MVNGVDEMLNEMLWSELMLRESLIRCIFCSSTSRIDSLVISAFVKRRRLSCGVVLLYKEIRMGCLVYFGLERVACG